jgi:hypothetical protein
VRRLFLRGGAGMGRCGAWSGPCGLCPASH